MREILYRLKICGKWAYGLPCKIRKDTVAFDGVFADGQSVYDAFADKETLGEYTGLTDKNGNKIFEGDIVKNHYAIGIVTFGEFSFSACDEYACTHYGVYAKSNYHNFYHDDGYALLPSENDRFELIGNIYENPELLEQ